MTPPSSFACHASVNPLTFEVNAGACVEPVICAS